MTTLNLSLGITGLTNVKASILSADRTKLWDGTELQSTFTTAKFTSGLVNLSEVETTDGEPVGLGDYAAALPAALEGEDLFVKVYDAGGTPAIDDPLYGTIDDPCGVRKTPATIAAGDIAKNAVDADSIKADAVAKIWAALTASLTTVGSVGKWLVDRLTGMPYAITPLAATASNTGRLNPLYLTAYQDCKIQATIVVLDANEDPVNLAGKALSLITWPSGSPETEGFELLSTGESPELSIGGDDNNEVTIDSTVDRTATPGDFDYRLYNTTDSVPLVDGVLRIVAGRTPA